MRAHSKLPIGILFLFAASACTADAGSEQGVAPLPPPVYVRLGLSARMLQHPLIAAPVSYRECSSIHSYKAGSR